MYVKFTYVFVLVETSKF